MLKVRSLARATTVVIVLFFVVLATVHEASAQSAPKVTSIKIPPGAKVQVDGKTARMIGQGVTGGAWDCSCSSGSGTCLVEQGPTALYCGGQGSTCKNCTFISTTGVSAGEISGAARAPVGATRK
jgi:hypothetical protein